MEPTLVVIGGPTAVGKTSIAIDIAEKLRTEIVSCDSRQCYREMTIGTAKPTEDELGRVTHHFINSHSIEQVFTAGDFYREGRQVLTELFRKYATVVVTGGSGLYLKALLDGIDPMPEIPAHIRDELNQQYDEDGLAPLKSELELVDPEFFQNADVNNPQRVIRALEVYRGTGMPFSSFRKAEASDPIPYNVVSVGLDRPREELYERINLRVDLMVEEGLIDEVKGLKPYREHYALQTVGYSEVFRFLDGELTEAEAVELVKQNSRRYAKRQLTWFRKYGGMTWFDAEKKAEINDFITRLTPV